jgi:hypothetical protein
MCGDIRTNVYVFDLQCDYVYKCTIVIAIHTVHVWPFLHVVVAENMFVTSTSKAHWMDLPDDAIVCIAVRTSVHCGRMFDGDFAEYPPLAVVARRNWLLLQYRFILSRANLTNNNDRLAARTEAMRYHARVLRCHIVPMVFSAIEAAGTPVHTIECFQIMGMGNPFHPAAPLILPNSSLHTLIVHDSKATRCFACQFVHLTSLRVLTVMLLHRDLPHVVSSLAHLQSLTHLRMDIKWAITELDKTLAQQALCNAPLQVLYLRICIMSTHAGNQALQWVGGIAPALTRLRHFHLSVVSGEYVSSPLDFDTLIPLVDESTPCLQSFTLDLMGLRSTDMHSSSIFRELIQRVIKHGRVSTIRIGVFTPIHHMRPCINQVGGVRSLTISAQALGDSLDIQRADDIVALLPDLESLHLYVHPATPLDLLRYLIIGLFPILCTLTQQWAVKFNVPSMMNLS